MIWQANGLEDTPKGVTWLSCSYRNYKQQWLQQMKDATIAWATQQPIGNRDVNCTSDKTIMERLLANYNNFRRPSELGVKVWIEVWVQEVNSINEITSDFDGDIYITELWVDQALRYDHMNPCKYNLSLNAEVLENIWKPNTVFINSKHAHIHKSPFPNVFLMVYPNGTVWVNYRVQVRGPCDFDFTSFPFDQQSCHLTMESFNYNVQEVDMQWLKQAPISLLKDEITLPDFTLSNYTAELVAQTYPAGIWNELTLRLTFSRRYGWYIGQAYVPTYLTIFISWISFCLGPKMVPARTMIGVNSLLALTFQFGNIMRNLPRVSYVKALDVWMLSCLTFVFGSLLELAAIGLATQVVLTLSTVLEVLENANFRTMGTVIRKKCIPCPSPTNAPKNKPSNSHISRGERSPLLNKAKVSYDSSLARNNAIEQQTHSDVINRNIPQQLIYQEAKAFCYWKAIMS